MAATKLDARFFESTRGRIILLLRGSSKTVNELAAEMKITDNAVRAHLLTLERDGLVAQSGLTKGFRKPHYLYSLTNNVKHIFPPAYDSLVNKLLAVLKSTLSPKAVMNILRDVGRGIGGDKAATDSASLDTKLDNALSAIEDLGGAARVVRKDDSIRIESDGCPFAEVVSEHPEVCKITESVLSEITGVAVTEKCDRTGSPKCCFEIEATHS